MLKRTIFSYIVPVAAVAAFIGGGVGLAGRNTSSFNGDGYVLTAADESANGGMVETVGAAEPTSVYFSAGTKYRVQYPSTAVFKDIEGSKQKINFDSFIHYGDDSISALTSGVLVNMDDLGTGVVNHYGTDANVVLVSDGDGYYVENNGNQVSFTNFMWKLSDTRFLLSSPSLTLTLPDGSSQKVSGYVEAEYVEDGVIRLTSHDASWMVVADGTAAEFSDGISYDFGDKIVKDSAGNNRMTFQELLLNADDNIKVQSAEEWVAPEFDFSVEDGKDGAAGEAGAAGAVGETGEAGNEGEEGGQGQNGNAGEEGDSGEDGRKGTSGSNGKGGDSGTNGGNGNNGNNGKLFDTETKYQAYFNITEYEMDAGSLTVTFTVTDEDAVLTPETGKIVLQNPNGSAVEWGSPDGSLTYSPDANLTFDGDGTYKVQWTNLNPDTQYRLIVSSGYELQNGSGTRDYINRTFYTDSTGLQLDKINAEADGFTMKVMKKNFATATAMKVAICDGTGQEVLTKTINSGDFTNGELELDSRKFDLADGSSLTNSSLVSNTTYTVKLYNIVGSQEVLTGNTQTWKTLKKAPVLRTTKPTGYAISTQYFSLNLEDVEDVDNAIQGYRFEIYDTSGSTKPVKTINSDKNTDVAAYIDDVNSSLPDNQKLRRGVNYLLKVIVIYYDNEKTAEVESGWSDQFIMSDAGETSVVFERDTTDTSTDQTMMDGDVILNPGNYQVAASEQYPMEIRIDGTNFYQKSYTIKSMTGNNGWIKSADSQTYRYKISLQGLKANSYYTISVWGYAETVPGTGTYMYRNLGSYVAATTKLDPVKVEMAPATGSGSALGTYIYLGPANDETDPENYSTTLKSIKAVEVKLYLGATPSKDDSNRIGNKDEEIMAVSDRSQPGVPYTNVIASTYYGKKGRDTNLIYVDESTFGLTSASLTASQYCIKVSAIYDYTKYYPYDEDGENENIGKYANEIPFTEDSTTSLPISVVNRLPDFPNPQNNGVQATPIKYSDLQGLGIRYTANDKDQYQDDTIVGYTLQANYDNSGDMGQSVTYYAFTQADLNEYNAQTSLDRGDDVMSWREKQTSRTTPWMKLTLPIAAKSLMPPAVRILFMEPTDVIGANKNVADITGTLNDTEKAANQAAVNGVAAQYMDGSTQTFFAPGLERGWHYIFAYQTRLYYQGSYAYVYPNGYTGRFLSGQTLLNSGIQDTPKQKTVLTMSLDHNTLSNNLTEHNKGIGQVVWNYNYTDLDGSIPTGNDGGLFAAWNTLSEGSSSILDSSTTDSKTNTQGQVVINTAGSMAYKINMRQKLYQAGDRYSATDTEEPKEVEVSAVNHTYTRPIDERDLRDNVMNVTIPESNKGNVATFSFNFDNDISDQMTTRLTRLVIRACDSQGEVNGSAQSYDKFDGTNVDGHPYVTYDLSKAGAAGKQVTFKAQMYYDSGYMGIKELDQNNPDQVLALQNATTGRYIVWRYEYVGNNMYPLNQNNTKENAGWSEYKISTTAPTSDQDLKATTAWKLQNLHNQKPSGADPADYPDPVMNLKESAGGLMDVETRGLYPIIKRVDHKELPLLDTQNRTKYITIPSLTPSVSNWWMVAGLTTIDSTFTTNSYDMIQETTPKDPVTGKNMKSGRYVHMVVREVLNNGTISTSITQQVYLEMSQQDTAKTYRYTFEGLEPGKTYAVELWCMQAGSTDTNETLFWNTTSGAQGEAARKNITLYKEMKINDPAVTEIEYKSYMEKTLTLTYNMDLASGFEIQYSIGKKNSDGSETPLLDHAGVMDLMGYQLNENNEWVKKSNPNAKWTLGVNMMETLTFEPKANATVVPGGNYVIHIVAKDSHQAQLGEGKVNFTWPPLVDPTFYVESTTINDGNRLRISFNPVDTNKVIAGGQYYAVVWGPENQIVAIQKCDVQAGVQSLTVDVEQKYQGKSYKVSFYAVTDMTNTWKDGLDIGSIDDNHKDQAAAILKGMTPLYETVQKTLQSWGGRYSKVMFVFNSSRSLLVYMYDASGLENITKVEVTLYRDGKTRNYVVTKPTNKSLFDLIPGSAVNYQTVIPTEETEQGSYKILRANFYTSRSDTEPQFYESGDAVLQ